VANDPNCGKRSPKRSVPGDPAFRPLEIASLPMRRGAPTLRFPSTQESAMSNGPTPFFHPRSVPLAVPGSRRTERCYTLQGEARRRGPGSNARIELVLVDTERDVRNVLGFHYAPEHFACDVEPGWRVLGWRMADGSMPYGDYDQVDPDLAQIDGLPEPCRRSECDTPPDHHVRNNTWPSLLT
jgi:hypothetical protein